MSARGKQRDTAVAAATEEDASDGSSGDTSSSSNSEDGDDAAGDLPAEAVYALMGLEAELEANPSLYDKHLEYISLLRQHKLRVKLRAAHERMAAQFPLTEQLWLDWVNDELEQVQSPDDIERIKGLFLRGTQDYLCTGLWSQYLDFIAELDPDVKGHTARGVAAMREACEAAVNAAGLHASLGGKLWNTYREYELEGLEGANGADKERQLERVRGLYSRQLALPLVGNEEVWDEYVALEAAQGQKAPARVASAHEKAQEALQLRSSYEEAVSAEKEPDAALLAAYLAYIKLEQVQGDPARVQVVYERAVESFPLTVDLWVQYVRYLDGTVGVAPVTARVARRATRNCPWSGPLWSAALRAADRAGAALEALGELQAAALGAGLQTYEEVLDVLLAHLDGVRRRAAGTGAGQEPQGALRAGFQAARDHLAAHFPDQVDRSLRLPLYWTHCEVHVLGDVVAARRVWEQATRGALGKYSEVWLSWAGFERERRLLKEARGVFRRAYNRKLEESGQYTVCAEWLRFEREEGSADDFSAAHAKVAPILDDIAAAAAAAATDASTAAAAQAAAKKAPGARGAAGKADKQPAPAARGSKAGSKVDQDGFKVPASRKAATGQGGKRPLEVEAEGDAATTPDTSKRVRLQGPEQAAPPAAVSAGENDDTEMGDASEPQGAGEAHAEGMAAASAKPKHSEENTVFVRGLPPNVTDKALQALFADCGRIVSIRIPTHPNGQRRNFGYVEFEDAAALDAAVAKDGAQLPGSHMHLTIAKSAPPGTSGGGGGGRGGGAAGRGRGGARFGPGGRGVHDYHGGGDGDGGGRGRGRGRGGFGLGHPGRGAGRYGLDDGPLPPAPRAQPRQHLQVEDGTPAGPPGDRGLMMPRSVAVAQQQRAAAAPVGAGEGSGGPGGDGVPKTNADFRALLLAGRKQ